MSPANNHQLKDILSLLMEEYGIDDAELSRATKVPASTISRIKINERANPTASTLRPIAKFFAVSVSQLLGDEPLPPSKSRGAGNARDFTYTKMPVLEWEWIMDWLENRKEKFESKLTYWISTEKELSENAFAIVIRSDSLDPVFNKNSLILIEPKSYPKDGDLILVLAEKDKLISLKKLVVDGPDLYVKSIHPEIRSIVRLNELLRILGVIVETRYSMLTTDKLLHAPSTALLT